jgi:hypothetical protein
MVTRRITPVSGLGVALLVLVSAACAPVSGSSGGSDGSCAAVFRYAGGTYLGDPLSAAGHPRQLGLVPASHRTRLGTARGPACEGTPTSNIQVWRVSTRRPKVVISDGSGILYVRLRPSTAVATPTSAAARARHQLSRARWVHWITP